MAGRETELRHRAVSALLEADGPLTLAELTGLAGVPADGLGPVLQALVEDEQVVAGRLVAADPQPRYRLWGAWAREIDRRTDRVRQEVLAAIGLPDSAAARRPDLHGAPALAFCDYVTNRYTPPEDKRILVVLQCSVRRPFSASPSHGSMRRAIATATGWEPAAQFVRCPVHVIVLASYVGPVPYELEDVFPANVRAGGVKRMSSAEFDQALPVLAGHMAAYIRAHRDSYDHITTFTEGRYAEVMAEAARLAGVDFPVLPDPSGPSVLKMGNSPPRTYWARYWLQLFRQVVEWLPAHQRARAEERFRALRVVCR